VVREARRSLASPTAWSSSVAPSSNRLSQTVSCTWRAHTSAPISLGLFAICSGREVRLSPPRRPRVRAQWTRAHLVQGQRGNGASVTWRSSLAIGCSWMSPRPGGIIGSRRPRQLRTRAERIAWLWAEINRSIEQGLASGSQRRSVPTAAGRARQRQPPRSHGVHGRRLRRTALEQDDGGRCSTSQQDGEPLRPSVRSVDGRGAAPVLPHRRPMMMELGYRPGFPDRSLPDGETVGACLASYFSS